MTRSLDAAITAVAEALDAISDPTERYEAMRRAEGSLGANLKRIRQQIALDLKAAGKTWREVGEIMGDVSPQRAEQMSRGV